MDNQEFKKYEKIIYSIVSRLMRKFNIVSQDIYDELVSMGFKILLRCYSLYDKNSNTKFSTYLYTSVNLKLFQTIRNIINDKDNIVYASDVLNMNSTHNDKDKTIGDYLSIDPFDFDNLYYIDTDKDNIFNLYYGLNCDRKTIKEISQIYPEYSLDNLNKIIEEKTQEYINENN